MHDLLYENQHDLGPDSLLEYAGSLGLNQEKFERDMESTDVKERIESDLYGGVRSGVNGTPCFFINERRYDGDFSFESMLAAIRSQMPAERAG